MPQLNPAPWFLIFVFSWIVFLFILPQKILSHSFPNEPLVKNSKDIKTNPWNWPWH
uniref:ATP synthase F0 subunit 8 n=1 Tax=Trachipterus ishikawae TaxID=1502862 RepID=UPI0026E3E948|nr:ATP synthase F0 subunit 8 [Trachipterus ishikawae]WJQ22809.1 ATP synthase F0 subunit 8 [Trachipterus ishikawae]